MLVASTTLQETLLALKIGFLVLLYLFIWRIVRTVGREVGPSQESFILRPAAGRGGIGLPGVAAARLVVQQSSSLEPGTELQLDSVSLTVGRGAQNDVVLDGDEFASARHVRVEPRRDGVWVLDLGSTNGTFVNGIQIDEPHRLEPGDVVRVGETDLRFEA